MKIQGLAGQSIAQLLRDQGVPEAKLEQTAREVAQLNQLDPAKPLGKAQQLTLPDRFEMSQNQQLVEQPTAYQHLTAQRQRAGHRLGSLGAHAFDGFEQNNSQQADPTKQGKGPTGPDQPLYIMPPPGETGGDDQPLYILPPPGETGGDDPPLYIMPPPGETGDDQPMAIMPPPGETGGDDQPMAIMPPPGETGGDDPPLYILPPDGRPHPGDAGGDHPPIYILPPGGFPSDDDE